MPAAPAAVSAVHEYSLSNEEFERVRALVRKLTGIALSDTKRELVYGRLVRRLRHHRLHSFSEYLDRLEQGDHEEVGNFCNAITTNLTSFFREPHHFTDLAERVLPALLDRKGGAKRLRIWSAGCSSGEEPYTIAMVIGEALSSLTGWDIKILATDLDTNMLATAAAGRYPSARFESLDKSRWQRWFEPAGGKGEYQANERLRQLVSFKQLNLIEPLPMKRPFDIIFCRNVVIYFDKPVQRELFARMARLQNAGNTLYIGHSESLHTVSDQYRLVGKTAYERLGARDAA